MSSSSLLEAMLLDPYREPNEVWIAARTDGVEGSGTQGDPFNGSSRATPTIVIYELKKDATDPTKAVVTTNGAHGFATGDLVTIGGVDIQLANLGDNYYVGTFEINVTGSTSFEYGMLRFGVPFEPFSGTAPVPPGGSIQCWRERERFDAIMRDVPANALIHIGPGVFETKGSNGIAPGGWQVKSGQRIVGTGMGITTLKLVNAAAVAWQQSAIVGSDLDGCEVSDLTVDANVDGQLSPRTNCACLALTGKVWHARIHRVRAINFGSNGPLGPQDPAYAENFTFFIGGNDVVDVVYEGCVAEQPGPNVAWNSTILHQSGGLDGTGKMHYGRGLVLRNNYVNGQIVYGQRAYVASLEVDGSNVVTLTTLTPHGHLPGGTVSVQGVRVAGSLNNRFNGVFKIEDNGLTDTVLKYTAFAPSSDLGEVTTDTPRTLDGGTFIGAPVSPHALGISIVSVAMDRKTFTVKTLAPYAPHNLTENSWIRVGNVVLNGIDPDKSGNPCNGLFRVTDVISKTQFKYVSDSAIPSSPPDNFTGNSFIVHGQGHAFMHADAGTGAVVEGNRLLHGATGGPWHDTASTLDLVARNNYYHDIDDGPYQNMGGQLEPPKTATGLTRSGLIATFKVGSQDHGLLVGQIVNIFGARVGGDPDNPFNGYFIVKSIGTDQMGVKFFTYEMTTVPAADADVSPTPNSRPVAQVANWSIENNVIELGSSPFQGYWSQPSGVIMDIGTQFSADIPYAFRQVFLRENIIRQADGQLDGNHYGFIVRRSEKLFVENNVIDVGGIAIQFKQSVTPYFFNNLNTAGKALPGYNEATMQDQSELANRIEDALVLSL